jgi:Holliday junction resolvasome RuvABC endonuclease subunit
MILGLDCSTAVCGWAMNKDTTIIDAGFIDISKIEENKDKAFHILKTLGNNPLIAQLKEVKLEAALSGFQRGRTSQQVVIKLARFNAVLEYILSQHWGSKVKLVNASTARKKVLGKSFIKGMSPKDYVKQELPKYVPNLEKYIKLTSRGNYDKRNGDTMDAIIISLS